MAERRLLAESQHGRNAPAFEAELGMADGVNTAMKAMESAGFDRGEIALRPIPNRLQLRRVTTPCCRAAIRAITKSPLAGFLPIW